MNTRFDTREMTLQHKWWDEVKHVIFKPFKALETERVTRNKDHRTANAQEGAHNRLVSLCGSKHVSLEGLQMALNLTQYDETAETDVKLGFPVRYGTAGMPYNWETPRYKQKSRKPAARSEEKLANSRPPDNKSRLFGDVKKGAGPGRKKGGSNANKSAVSSYQSYGPVKVVTNTGVEVFLELYFQLFSRYKELFLALSRDSSLAKSKTKSIADKITVHFTSRSDSHSFRTAPALIKSIVDQCDQHDVTGINLLHKICFGLSPDKLSFPLVQTTVRAKCINSHSFSSVVDLVLAKPDFWTGLPLVDSLALQPKGFCSDCGSALSLDHVALGIICHCA
ncbi:hypothetical protein HDU98_005631 [Podochytrium sp. JEL0797]|nr:hypothetical protein HDU98_005631 [Podochytrium sp. JEL0797]